MRLTPSSEMKVTLGRFAYGREHRPRMPSSSWGRGAPAQGGRQSGAGFKVTSRKAQGIKSKPLDFSVCLLRGELECV